MVPPIGPVFGIAGQSSLWLDRLARTVGQFVLPVDKVARIPRRSTVRPVQLGGTPEHLVMSMVFGEFTF